MTLRDLKPGDAAKVVKINGEGAIKRRIMDMGLIKGTSFVVKKVAPLGDPVEITVRGSLHCGTDCLSAGNGIHRQLRSGHCIWCCSTGLCGVYVIP